LLDLKLPTNQTTDGAHIRATISGSPGAISLHLYVEPARPFAIINGVRGCGRGRRRPFQPGCRQQERRHSVKVKPNITTKPWRQSAGSSRRPTSEWYSFRSHGWMPQSFGNGAPRPVAAHHYSRMHGIALRLSCQACARGGMSSMHWHAQNSTTAAAGSDPMNYSRLISP
jgi:hypothetical protein